MKVDEIIFYTVSKSEKKNISKAMNERKKSILNEEKKVRLHCATYKARLYHETNWICCQSQCT
jgi:hypothetical protein